MTLNRRTNTAHVFLKDYEDADISRQYMLVEHDVRGDFTLELDKKGVLLSEIQIKFASSGLPKEFLDEAQLV